MLAVLDGGSKTFDNTSQHPKTLQYLAHICWFLNIIKLFWNLKTHALARGNTSRQHFQRPMEREKSCFLGVSAQFEVSY